MNFLSATDIVIAYRDAFRMRNRGMSFEEIEAELLAKLGKTKVIWLSRSPLSDRVFAGPKIANYFGWGANGHTDEYVRLIDDHTILLGTVPEEERAQSALAAVDGEILDQNRRELEAARTLRGEPFDIIEVPMPDLHALSLEMTWPQMVWNRGIYGEHYDEYVSVVCRDFGPEDPVRYTPASSYLNYVITNGVVLLPKFGGEGRPPEIAKRDEEVRALFERVFPDREIVQIDSLPLNWRGGVKSRFLCESC